MFREGQQIDLPGLAVGLELPTSKFTVRRVLRGGMGVCAKIVHDLSARAFALKMISDAALQHAEAFERFRQEVKIWTSASTCDAVVEVFSVFRINEIPCVCSEWMEGGDLRDYLKGSDSAFLYRSIDRVLAGLEWVYATYGIVHRDLKPANILLDRQLDACIADWGISRVVSIPAADTAANHDRPLSAADLTQTGRFIGTVMYSSPEQIIGSKAIDHRADIYSIGCILHEWETGNPPFMGKTPEQIAYQNLESPVPRISGLFRRSRFGIEKVVARCLQKRPEDRYQTYAELRSELEVCAKSRDVELTPFTPTTRGPMPLVGGEEIRRKGFKNAVPGSKGYAVAALGSVSPYLKEAEVLCNVSEWQKAYDILIRLYIPETISEFPDYELHQRIAIDIGLCLLRMGRAPEAVEALRTLSRADSKPAEYFLNLSLALLQARRDGEAEGIAQQGLRLYPNDADILGNLSIALMGQRKNTAALDVARRRLALTRNVHSLEELAMAHMALGHEVEDPDWPRAVREFAIAITLLVEARNLNSRYVSARLNLAKAWFLLDDFGTCMGELIGISQLRLDRPSAELSAVAHAECLNRAAAFEECLTFCKKWLKEIPESTSLLRVRAETIVEAYVIGKEKAGVHVVEDSSLEFFTRIVSDSETRKPSDLRYLARLKEWMGEKDDAFKLIGTAEELEPKHWENSFNRAAFYWRLGDLTSALFHAQKACALAPWRPQTWRLIATVQDSRGEKEEAQSSRNRAEKVSQARTKLSHDAVAGRIQSS